MISHNSSLDCNPYNSQNSNELMFIEQLDKLTHGAWAQLGSHGPGLSHVYPNPTENFTHTYPDSITC